MKPSPLQTAASDNKSRMEDNLIPMINIIFLLLIFFMVAGHITDQTVSESLTLPTLAHNAPASSTDITISMDADGVLEINQQPTTLADIPAHLNKSTATITRISVQADQSLDMRTVDTLLDVLRRDGTPTIALQTQYQATGEVILP